MAAFVLLAALITIFPWEYSLYREHHKIYALSTGGYPTLCDGFVMNNKSYRGKVNLPNDVEALSDSFFKDYSAYEHQGKSIVGFIKKQLSESPITVFKFYGIKAARAWYGTDSQLKSVEFMDMLIMGTYLVFFAIGLWTYRKHNMAILILFAILIFYYWAITTITFSILRYMIPVLPIILIFSAVGIGKTAEKIICN